MSERLHHLLSSFSWLAFCAAIAAAGLACHRLGQRSGERAFAVAAWLALGYLLLTAIPYTIEYAIGFAGLSPAWFHLASAQCSDVAGALLFGHFLLLSVAFFRTARRLAAHRTRESARKADSGERGN